MDTGNKHTRDRGRHRGPGQCRDIELNVTSEQLRRFEEVLGPVCRTVLHKGVRFTAFADTVVNSGLPEEQAFFEWAEGLKALPRAGHHVWILHYPLFADRPDEPTWDIATRYRDWYFTIDEPGRNRLLKLFRETGADLVISGHVHCRKAFDVDEIRFQIAPATSFGQWPNRWPDGDSTPGFLRYEVSDAGLRSEFVPLEKTWDLPGRGPGGHPDADARTRALGGPPRSP